MKDKDCARCKFYVMALGIGCRLGVEESGPGNSCSEYQMEPDGSTETRILTRLSERLSMGRAQYGPLDVHDGQDWLEEAIQEAADLLIYLECLKEQRDGVK